MSLPPIGIMSGVLLCCERPLVRRGEMGGGLGAKNVDTPNFIDPDWRYNA